MNIHISRALTTAVVLAVLLAVDSHRRGKSSAQTIIFFGGGLLGILPVLILYRQILSPDLAGNLYTLLGRTISIGVFQEIAKLIFFYMISQRIKSKDPLESALQAASLGLGFSFISLDSQTTIAVMLSIMGHVLIAGIWGYGFALQKRRGIFLVLGFLPLALIQGLYGFLLELNLYWVAVYVNLVVLVGRFALSRIFRNSSPRPSALGKRGVDNKTPRFIALNPTNPLFPREILSCLKEGNYDLALMYIDRSLALREHPYLRAVKGIILMLSGRLDQGEALLQKARRHLSSSMWWNLRRTVRRLVEGRSEAVNQAVQYNLFFIDQALRFTDLDAYTRLIA